MQMMTALRAGTRNDADQSFPVPRQSAPPPPPPARVAILRALQLGDLLCAVPAFRAARAAWPEAHIALIGLPWARQLVRRYRQYLDDFIPFPGYPGMPERDARVADIPSFLAAVQRARFDLALQLHGSGEITNSLVGAFGATACAGSVTPGRYHPPGNFVESRPDESEVSRLLRVLAAVGVPDRGEYLEFPLTASDRGALAGVPVVRGSGTYVCVHPGGRATARRWGPAGFAAVADVLAGYGFQVVLTGTSAEAPLVNEVVLRMRHPATNAAGRTSLGALGALLAGARLLIANDTGVAHLAEAVRAPSIVLFHETQVARWGPRDQSRHRVLCPLDRMTPSRVLREAEDLLAAHGLRPRRPAAAPGSGQQRSR